MKTGRRAEIYSLPDRGESPRRRFLRAAFLVAFAPSLLGAWLATQLFAARLDYDPRLGRPWWPQLAAPRGELHLVAVGLAVFGLLALAHRRTRPLAILGVFLAGGTEALAHGPLYSPFHLFYWYSKLARSVHLGPDISRLVREWAALTLGCAGAFIAAALWASTRYPDLYDIHGSARWASEADVRESGLLKRGRRRQEAGIFLGYWPSGRRRRPLIDSGPHHCFCYAPTRSGKGIGLVIPNLLSWPHSVLVHDIKGENWALTAGYRKRKLHQTCLRFDPTAPEGTAARYNPLLAVRPNELAVRDAQNIADILVDPNGDKTRDHWDRTAHALLTAVILHVLYAEEDKTLRGCAAFLSGAFAGDPVDGAPSHTTREALERMRSYPHLGVARPHPVVAALAQAVLDKADNERSGVISTALSYLDLYRDPLIAANTAACDFTLDDLMNAQQPVSLYLTVPPSDISRTRPLVRLLLNQACRRLTETLTFKDGKPEPHYRYPLLLLLDEFPALGRLPFFQESLAYLAGYGIRAFLITQDLSQHQGVYGREESITANCHVRIAFTPNKTETAELLSQMAGETTVHQEKTSRTMGGGLFALRSSVSPVETRRRLLTADEAMRFPAHEELIFASGTRPIRALKARYFEERELQRRARLPAPERSDRLEPTQNAWTAPSPLGEPTPAPRRDDSRARGARRTLRALAAERERESDGAPPVMTEGGTNAT